MKREFVSPKLELCEFVVAARLNGSSPIGGAHDNSPNSACSKVASSGPNSCALPSLSNSGPTPRTC